jgi:hypothetical protein
MVVDYGQLKPARVFLPTFFAEPKVIMHPYRMDAYTREFVKRELSERLGRDVSDNDLFPASPHRARIKSPEFWGIVDELRAVAYERPVTKDELQSMLAATRHEGIWLQKTWPRNRGGAPGCWLSGAPSLPAHIEWPSRKLPSGQSNPLYFAAQFNCAELKRVFPRSLLPECGTVFFFYDPIFGCRDDWNGPAKIIHTPEDSSGLPIRQMPALAPLGDLRSDPWFHEDMVLPPEGELAPRQNVTLLPLTAYTETRFHCRAYDDAVRALVKPFEDRFPQSDYVAPKGSLFDRLFPKRPEEPPKQYNHNLFVGPCDGDWSEATTRPILTLVSGDEDIGVSTPNDIPITFKAPIGATGMFSLEEAEVQEWEG